MVHGGWCKVWYKCALLVIICLDSFTTAVWDTSTERVVNEQQRWGGGAHAFYSTAIRTCKQDFKKLLELEELKGRLSEVCLNHLVHGMCMTHPIFRILVLPPMYLLLTQYRANWCCRR